MGHFLEKVFKVTPRPSALSSKLFHRRNQMGPSILILLPASCFLLVFAIPILRFQIALANPNHKMTSCYHSAQGTSSKIDGDLGIKTERKRWWPSDKNAFRPRFSIHRIDKRLIVFLCTLFASCCAISDRRNPAITNHHQTGNCFLPSLR